MNIYTVHRDGSRSVLDFRREQDWQVVVGPSAIWAAEISAAKDGDMAYAAVNVLRGSDMESYYEDAKCYVQDNMI
jgi:hypothetical protein